MAKARRRAAATALKRLITFSTRSMSLTTSDLVNCVGVVVSGVTLVLHFNEQITKVSYGIGEGLHDGLLLTSIPDRPVLYGPIDLPPCATVDVGTGPGKKVGAGLAQAVEQGVVARTHGTAKVSAPRPPLVMFARS